MLGFDGINTSREAKVNEPARAVTAEGPVRITSFYDKTTNTLSYLLADAATRKAAIIDPVLDYDWRSGRVSTRSADAMIEAARGLSVEWILDTHVHADHLTAADYLRGKLGARLGIGARVVEVQRIWRDFYNIGASMPVDGSQFDRLFADGDEFSLGTLEIAVWHTPGHTPACVSYIVRGASGPASVFVGDTMFMPDSGTARTDFPGGDAAMLYRSLRRLMALPADTRAYVCHDYQPEGRPLAFLATMGEQRRANIHVHEPVGEAEFVAFRTGRDTTLSVPQLLLPSIQVNIAAGKLPAPEANGTAYLKIPLNRL
jgi:glyoxylase-like metal-dependent hydrolase (beta-lactamase superfamily II)